MSDPMSAGRVESVRIRGFRSLADVELSNLRQANVLIGANGSGKSNFIRFFEMMHMMLGPPRGLNEFVQRDGGGDDQLYGGSAVTSGMAAALAVRTDEGRNEYRFTLSHAHPDRLVFVEEAVRVDEAHASEDEGWYSFSDRHPEPTVVYLPHIRAIPQEQRRAAQTIVDLLRSCAYYQFHDTSGNSNFKKRWDVEDNNCLLPHGGNLAAVLHRLERQDRPRFEAICRHIRRVLPVFDRFQIEESFGKVSLRWKAVGVDKTFGAHLTSDGSLRFFALVTLLNLPREMLPAVLLLDEPELGLHPVAVSLLGAMLKALAVDRQIIVATQSPLVVDAFDIEEVVVADLDDGTTRFRRLESKEYEQWLDGDFTPGELWQKNLFGGRP